MMEKQELNLTFPDYVAGIAPDLLAYFARRVSPLDYAADCVSETLAVLWRRLDDLPAERDAQRAWTFGIARGVLQNYRRAGSRRIALADQLRAALPVVPIFEPNDSRIDLLEALSSLKEADRELVLLVAWEGVSLEAAAGILRINAPAARARYSRARAKLRDALS
jgi:RNA polymerase sigma-70 factor (ECF subfamily)